MAVERDLEIRFVTKPTDVPDDFTFEVPVGTLERRYEQSERVWVFTWHVPSLAPGQTLRVRGSAPYAYSAQGGQTGENPVLTGLIEARPLEFDTEDNWTQLDLRAAPSGLVDLRVNAAFSTVGANAGQRILRATVSNGGPNTLDATAGARVRVSAYADFWDSSRYWAQITARRALTSGWTCDNDGCYPTQSLAPGQTAQLEFVLDGEFPHPGDKLIASINNYSAIPDWNPANNTLPTPPCRKRRRFTLGAR